MKGSPLWESPIKVDQRDNDGVVPFGEKRLKDWAIKNQGTASSLVTTCMQSTLTEGGCL